MQNLLKTKPFFFAIGTWIAAIIGLELYLTWKFSPDQLSQWPEKRAWAHARDDHGKIMAKVISRQNNASREPTVFLIGGSTLREGLVPDAILGKMLDEMDVETAPKIQTLYSFDQSLAETYRIVSALPLTSADRVSINVNPRRLSIGTDSVSRELHQSRLALIDKGDLAAVRRDLARGPVEAGIAQLDSTLYFWQRLAVFEKSLFVRSWITSRLDSNFKRAWGDLTSLNVATVDWSALAQPKFREIRRGQRYAYANIPLEANEKAKIFESIKAERVPEFQQNMKVNLALLRRTIDVIQSKGAQAMILELPRSPQSVEAYGPIWNSYASEVSSLVDEKSIYRLNLQNMAFGNDAYYDLEHLLARHRPELSKRVLAEMMSVSDGR